MFFTYLYVYDVLSIGKRGYVSAVGTYTFLFIVLLQTFIKKWHIFEGEYSVTLVYCLLQNLRGGGGIMTEKRY